MRTVDDFTAGGNSGAPSLAPVELASPIEGVELWFVTLAASDDEFARVSAWLSPAEHARAARFGREYLRRRYIIGRASLRWALGRTLEASPASVPIVRGERGRPKLDGIDGVDFNVSHTDDAALIGIARGRVRIGVDIELVDREVNADGLARKFLTAAEQVTLVGLSPDERRVRFLRYWTCKEAMSKATGDGLAAPFQELQVNLEASVSLASGPAPYEPARWELRPANVAPRFVATLALWARK